MQLIDELPYMRGNDLSVPLSNKLYGQFEKMISVEQIKCINIVEKYIEDAKEQGDDFNQDLKEAKPVLELWQSLDFFNRHSLFTGADKLF